MFFLIIQRIGVNFKNIDISQYSKLKNLLVSSVFDGEAYEIYPSSHIQKRFKC